MKKQLLERKLYVAPKCELLELENEAVMAGSVVDEWDPFMPPSPASSPVDGVSPAETKSAGGVSKSIDWSTVGF